MSKYAPLSAYLKLQQRNLVPMTFLEIEQVLGFELPPSKRNRAWWSNNPDNSVMTKTWLDAGYKSESVDIAGERLVFRRMGEAQVPGGASAHGHLQEGGTTFGRIRRHPGFGFMKGLLTIEEGFDITKPFDDEAWDAGYLGFEEKR